MLLSLGSVGCAKVVRLYPITNQDIAYIKKGEPAQFDGIEMSEFYLNEVLQARIEAK